MRSTWIGLEHLGVHLVDLAQRFQRQVQVGFRIVGAAERQVHALQDDIVTLLFDPLFELRFQRIAVRAVVHEELDHLDLLADRLHRLRLSERHVLDTAFRVGRRSESRGGHGRGDEAGGKQGETQGTHKYPSRVDCANDREITTFSRASRTTGPLFCNCLPL
jgi:hypothetical protein